MPSNFLLPFGQLNFFLLSEKKKKGDRKNRTDSHRSCSVV